MRMFSKTLYFRRESVAAGLPRQGESEVKSDDVCDEEIERALR
jgi:hypothetical protein